MSSTIYLYLKTHNQTGLKYLGKTIRDPYVYTGSGVYWKSHLKKHGNDVKTEILFETSNKEEFNKVALEYSYKYNIVESSEFANLTHEEGQGGNTCLPGSDSWNRMTQSSTLGMKYNSHKEYELSDVGRSKIKKAAMMSPSEISKNRMSNSAKNRPRMICPYCNKEGDISNMTRWHGSNCKNAG